MTSAPKSSKSSPDGGPQGALFAPVESLAGVFHPHAIEVQDFSFYALVMDLRTPREYAIDHLPGALRFDPPPMSPQMLTTSHDVNLSPTTLRAEEPSLAALTPAMDAALAGVKLDEAVLVYGGESSATAHAIARTLRWRGLTADVLPGGWPNYRRWVQAGLEVLPRLVPWRVIACTLGSESARVLSALRALGHQVLDVESLAGARRFAGSAPPAPQPDQAGFDGQLLHALRALDALRPVWVDESAARLGSIALPGAMVDALAVAPIAALHVPLAERVRAWRADDPAGVEVDAVLRALEGQEPPAMLPQRWRDLESSGDVDGVLSSVLRDHLDALAVDARAARSGRRHALPPLVASTLEPEGLRQAIADWLPSPPT